MTNSLFKKTGLLAMLIIVGFSAYAQHGNPLQFLSNISQSSQINPAFQNTNEKMVVGLPLIGGTTLNYNANFAINDFHTADFSFDYQNFYNALNEYGDAFSLAQVPIIYLSLKRKNKNYSFSVTERFIGDANFNSEILNFFAQGLQPYSGENETIDPISIKANYFREIAVGYSEEIWKGFSLGIRPKIMFGKFYYKVDNIDVTIETIEEQELLRVKPEGKLTVSGPLKVVFDEDNEYESVKPDMNAGDYFFKPKNMGAGIDLGLTYNINKETEVSIAILDLGFTSINYKAYDIIFDDALHYNTNNLYQSHNPDAPNYWSPQLAARTMNDSIPYITDVESIGKRRYEALPIQLTAQLKYKLPNNLKVGAANHFTYYKNHSTNFFTGFIHAYLGENFETVATLNIYNLDTIMPGIGGSYSGKSVQYYFSTNNILELVRPTSAKNINLCFGVNFLFPTN